MVQESRLSSKTRVILRCLAPALQSCPLQGDFVSNTWLWSVEAWTSGLHPKVVGANQARGCVTWSRTGVAAYGAWARPSLPGLAAVSRGWGWHYGTASAWEGLSILVMQVGVRKRDMRHGGKPTPPRLCNPLRVGLERCGHLFGAQPYPACSATCAAADSGSVSGKTLSSETVGPAPRKDFSRIRGGM